ncbi:MAG: 50S ribosomal protein L3 [Thermofilum sp.]|nr:50S ribosomal protein L3 [Thermofilum sp.]
MTKGHRPRRGSRAYYPRKRARSIVARIKRWPKDREGFLGFAGYKVGMLHVVGIETHKFSPFQGQEIVYPATVIEVPGLRVLAVRVYGKTPQGRRTLCEVWSREVPKDVERVFTTPKDPSYYEEQVKKLEEVRDKVSEVRVIVATQPRLAGIGKKKPELFEIAVGGSPDKALKIALEKLGKELTVSDVFKEGDYVDVIAVTKGKGFAGSVKRFGVEEMPRWHKHRKGHSRIGAVGPQKPSIMFYTPFPGQLGFHQRTEYNKKILKIGDASSMKEINPPGGWKHYGLIKSQFIIIEGSIPGPAKRLVKLRHAIRPGKVTPVPQITYLSTSPWQIAG